MAFKVMLRRGGREDKTRSLQVPHAVTYSLPMLPLSYKQVGSSIGPAMHRTAEFVRTGQVGFGSVISLAGHHSQRQEEGLKLS